MSNLQIIAQSTQPLADPQAAMVVYLLVLAGAITSGAVIVRRRLWIVPPMPHGAASPNARLLAGTLLFAVALFIGILSIIIHLLGLTPEQTRSPEGLRQTTLYTPLAHLAAGVVVLLMLWPYLPRVLHWTRQRTGYFRQAFTMYLLAIPWVLLTGIVVQILVHAFEIDAKSQHPFFDVWQAEGPGFTPFKLAAVFSAVVVAPLVEELIFRGVAQRLADRLTGSTPLAILLASMAFAVVHSPWTTQPSVFVLSLFLGCAYARSGTILVPMLLHAIFNAIQFLFFAAFGAP